MKMRELGPIASVLLGFVGTATAQEEERAVEATGVGATTGVSTTEAPAQQSPGAGGDKRISVGLLLGYGITFESGKSPWGLGLGVRGGYNLHELFLGARFVHYLGEEPIGSWELGVEGGYDLAVGDELTLRPGVGLGIMSVNVDMPPPSGGSSTDVYIAPGASLFYDLADDIFVGAEARLELVLSDPTGKGLILLANAGMRF